MPGMRCKESSKDKDMTKLEDLKKEYNVFSKKEHLPEFEDLDDVFEIRAIDLERGNLVNSIIRIMMSTINNHLELIYPVINPNPSSFYSMSLHSYMNEKDKEKITKLYAALIQLQLGGTKTLLESNKEKAGYINKLHKLYPGIRNKIRESTNLFVDSWEKAMKESDKKDKKPGFLG